MVGMLKQNFCQSAKMFVWSVVVFSGLTNLVSSLLKVVVLGMAHRIQGLWVRELIHFIA